MGLFDKIGDVFEDVTDALVEAAPVILPIALNYFAPGMGTIASSALGSGIGTLISGGSTKDALRNAALAGATGAVAKGIGSLNQGDTFMEGVRGDLGTTRNFLTGATADAGSDLVETAVTSVDNAEPVFEQQASTSNAREMLASAGEGQALAQTKDLPVLPERSFITSPFAKDLTPDQIRGSQNYMDLVTGPGAISPEQAFQEIRSQFDPTFLSRFGAPLAGIAALSLSQDPEEEEFFESPLTGADLAYDEDGNLLPEYATDVAQIQPDLSNILVPYERRPMFVDPLRAKDGGVVPSKYKGFASLPEAVQMKIDEDLAAKYKEGGKAFPRRTGGIGPGEGSGTKDDVPALLMDGEFVMTRDAVKGAGNGSLKKGIAKMYDVMGDLENRARA